MISVLLLMCSEKSTFYIKAVNPVKDTIQITFQIKELLLEWQS